MGRLLVVIVITIGVIVGSWITKCSGDGPTEATPRDRQTAPYDKK